ncbi:hypothetical protein PIB30_037776 [Stylosanthes scabra]|uniref:Secreted protein n=1 Tax=Stylosanthes scabra TaxID=79078 RepID=A0ABU6XCY3_9FABA|nr:hypothetical protein [Stylosanthes scabra]
METPLLPPSNLAPRCPVVFGIAASSLSCYCLQDLLCRRRQFEQNRREEATVVVVHRSHRQGSLVTSPPHHHAFEFNNTIISL